VSCGPSGDEGPTVYILTKEKKQQKQPVPRADKNLGGKLIDCKYAVVQSSDAHNFYWVSIVHTFCPPSYFPRPPQATKNKKTKTKTNYSTCRS
jgi:hypothetical protein